MNRPTDRTVFLGLARNCAHALPGLLAAVTRMGERLDDWGYVFLESDSYDGTLRALDAFDRRHRRGIVRGYGRLRRRLDSRTERLAYLRNECLDLVRDDPRLAGFDFAVVMDMDSVNQDVDPDRVVSLLNERPRQWAALFANQSERYFDIWALRHPQWSPDDCWARVEGRGAGMSRETAVQRFVESRMIKIPPDAERIEVDSAFGGLGIYQLPALLASRYAGRTPDGDPVCEHVLLHEGIRAGGGRLFIEPSLINGPGTQEHKRSVLGKVAAFASELVRPRPALRQGE